MVYWCCCYCWWCSSDFDILDSANYNSYYIVCVCVCVLHIVYSIWKWNQAQNTPLPCSKNYQVNVFIIFMCRMWFSKFSWSRYIEYVDDAECYIWILGAIYFVITHINYLHINNLRFWLHIIIYQMWPYISLFCNDFTVFIESEYRI